MTDFDRYVDEAIAVVSDPPPPLDDQHHDWILTEERLRDE